MHQLAVNASGQVDLDAAGDAMQNHKPGLVAAMLANNETGVIQDVASVAELARSHGAYVHTDACLLYTSRCV